jgi:cardiolipin synthase A/B
MILFLHQSSILLGALGVMYLAALVITITRVLLETHSSAKTLAYLLVVVLFPWVGMIFYYSVGGNYRHRKLKNKGVATALDFISQFRAHVKDETEDLIRSHAVLLGQYTELVRFIHQLGNENLSRNEFRLLVNGEEKFPDVLENLEKAGQFIHMEYYAWENDIRGNQVKEVLLRKIKEGVKVRVLYDAYASRKIRTNIVKELREGGAEIHPVIPVKFINLANRVNHRDHRKIIIIDGKIGYTGGINVSDRYDNSIDTGLYWRDTHVRITGPSVLSLQRYFLINWNAAQNKVQQFDTDLFPDLNNQGGQGLELAQIIGGGPIYPMSNIMLTYFRIFSLAQKNLYITNPYFIPSESILDALKEAAISGVDVRLMLPEKSDSAIVGAASKFYFMELLQAGVRIFLYKKGFVHAKTVVADTRLSVVGTANMDIRSFDLNFEIMSVIYGENFAKQMEGVYLDDLTVCREVTYDDWRKTGRGTLLLYASARLISSFL